MDKGVKLAAIQFAEVPLSGEVEELKREAITGRATLARARFFLRQAAACGTDDVEVAEHNLNAAIVFGRSVTFHLQRIRNTKALRVEDAEGQAVGAPANSSVTPGRPPGEERESERGHGDRFRGRVVHRRGARSQGDEPGAGRPGPGPRAGHPAALRHPRRAPVRDCNRAASIATSSWASALPAPSEQAHLVLGDLELSRAAGIAGEPGQDGIGQHAPLKIFDPSATLADEVVMMAGELLVELVSTAVPGTVGGPHRNRSDERAAASPASGRRGTPRPGAHGSRPAARGSRLP